MKTITRHLLAVAGAVALTATSAGAQIVQYNTTGSFNGGSNVLTCAPSGSLTFTGLLAQLAGPGNISFGTIDATGSCQILPGNSFDLTVVQTAPPAGSGDFNGHLTGTFTAVGSNMFLDFTNTTVTLGTSTYTVYNHVAIVAPSTNNGRTTIQGSLTVTPEPASMTLLATGLVGIFGAARRKRKAMLNA